MASSIFLLYLVWVSVQDCKEMQVVRYSHVLGIFGVTLQFFLQKEAVLHHIIEYLAAILILCFYQIAAARLRLYGIADAIVFFLCGLFLLGKMGIDEYLFAYLLLQALAGVALLGIQVVKGNVKGMRLARPTPYIPYICFAFILTNVVL